MPPRRPARAAATSGHPKHVEKALLALWPTSERLAGRKLPELSDQELRAFADDLQALRSYVSGTSAAKLLAEFENSNIAAAFASLTAFATRRDIADDGAEVQHRIAICTLDLVGNVLRDAAASTLSDEQAARALALQDTLLKTRALTAAARQAAAASAALRGSPAAAAASASSARLRLRAAQQAAALTKLLGVLANLAKAKQRQGLVIALLAALRESSLLSHLGRLLLLLPPPPGEEPVPQALLTAHRDACLELCRAVSLTSSAASLLGGDPERHVRPALGPCAGHALLTLGSAALAAADLGPCGLPYSPVPLVPEQGGAPYPCVSGVVFFYGAVEMKIDQMRPRPTVHPRAAIRLMLRALKLCGVSARAKLPGAVRRGPQGMLSVDLSLGGSRRAGSQDFKLLLPPAEVGELSYQALSALVVTVRRWPAAWVAEAAAGWAPLVTSVVHTLPAAGAKMDLWLSALAPLLAAAAEPLVSLQGTQWAIEYLNSELPPCVAAALEGGVVPLFETLLRVAGEDPSGPEARVLLRLLTQKAPHYALALLVVHSPPRQAAAFLATLAKTLRRMAPPDVTASLPFSPPFTLACFFVDQGVSALAGIAAEFEPPGPVDPAAPAAPICVLAGAVLTLLPELSDIFRRAAIQRRKDDANREGPASIISAFAPSLLRAYSHALDLARREEEAAVARRAGSVGAGGGVRGLGGAAPLLGASSGRRTQRAAPGPGGSAEGPAPTPGHRVTSAVCLPFLVEECGAVPLLGALLDLLLVPGALQAWPQERFLALAGCCLGLSGAWPGVVSGAEGGSAGSKVGAPSWRPPAVRALAGLLRGAHLPLSQNLESLATWLERPDQVSLEPMPEVTAALAAEAGRLAALKAEVRALLPACANPACANLAGDSEAGLQLKRCGGCSQASYCGCECQAAHWKAGHKAVCESKGR